MIINLKKFILFIFLITFTFPNKAENNKEFILAEAKQIIYEFKVRLKKELMNAISSGGLKNGVEICSVRAQEIASELSKKYDWRIGRTSLKVRNKNNTPDNFIRGVLEDFEVIKENKKIKDISFYEKKGKQTYFLKPIETKVLCLGCHGSNIDRNLKSLINKIYPDDLAYDFKEGDIRGAFLLIKDSQQAN